MTRRISRHMIPHARGDEPQIGMAVPPEGAVFPTHVGMNRKWRTNLRATRHVFPTHVGMNRR